jgi:hypothetical protein
MELTYKELDLIDKLLMKHHGIKGFKNRKIKSDINALELAIKIIKEQNRVLGIK